MELSALAPFVFSALLCMGISPVLIPYLHRLKFDQTIRENGPTWHNAKGKTPTMGGLAFVAGTTAGVLLGGLVCLGRMPTNAVLVLLCALSFGFVGFIDDYIKVVKKRNLGLNEKQKLILQFLVAGAYLLSLYLSGGSSVTLIPFLGGVDLGIFYWVISLLGIVGMVNAVNFTDGIDGLNASVTFFASLIFMVIAGILGANGMGILAAATAGGCLGFLIWNFNPAKVFMGDTGSLFLGGMVCALGFGLNLPVLILPIGIIYIVEILSVVLQVTYFKATGGKRLFKMSPIHHHFEMCGWSEVKICAVFSLVTLLFGAFSVAAAWFGL